MSFKPDVSKFLQAGFDVTADWGDIDGSKGEGGTGFVHVPARGSLEIILLCDVPVSYKGHYVGGRMHPCLRQGCSACARSVGAQHRWVFSVYDCTRSVCALLELGVVPAGIMREFSLAYGGLRGLRVKLSKVGGTIRGRIELEVSGLSKMPAGDLPDSVDISHVLKNMWSEQSTKSLLSGS